MPLDTYAAPDVRQLFAEVETRLGPDAIVLHVKRVRQLQSRYRTRIIQEAA